MAFALMLARGRINKSTSRTKGKKKRRCKSHVRTPCWFIFLFGRVRFSHGWEWWCSGDWGWAKRLGLVVLLLLVLGVVLGGGVLVLLVLGHEVVHVGLGLGELHLVHALAGVPVKEGLAPEHGGELLRYALEQLLDGGRVTDEGARHLEATR